MLNHIRIALYVALLAAGASSALALGKSESARPTAPGVQRQLPPDVGTARAADWRPLKPFSAEEKAWFRFAEGPEWN
jgi:hypothetical protein